TPPAGGSSRSSSRFTTCLNPACLSSSVFHGPAQAALVLWAANPSSLTSSIDLRLLAPRSDPSRYIPRPHAGILNGQLFGLTSLPILTCKHVTWLCFYFVARSSRSHVRESGKSRPPDRQVRTSNPAKSLNSGRRECMRKRLIAAAAALGLSALSLSSTAASPGDLLPPGAEEAEVYVWDGTIWTSLGTGDASAV